MKTCSVCKRKVDETWSIKPHHSTKAPGHNRCLSCVPGYQMEMRQWKKEE